MERLLRHMSGTYSMENAHKATRFDKRVLGSAYSRVFPRLILTVVRCVRLSRWAA